MKVYQLEKTNSILNHFLIEIRDKEIQKDALRFRKNIERIGEILAYEISKSMVYQTTEVVTPLGKKTTTALSELPVILSVLRAGLPLHNGILNYLDKAENAFISAYRNHTNTTDFDIKVDYFATPNLNDKILIIADPMLATGKSLWAVLEVILKSFKPKKIYVASVIASSEGLDFIQKHFPENTSIFVGSIDDELNEKGYIIPGLGDAGDLAFGSKM